MADAHEERALHDLCDAHGLTRLARRGAAKGHFFSLKTDFVADFSLKLLCRQKLLCRSATTHVFR
jgi:hypothetical protein